MFDGEWRGVSKGLSDGVVEAEEAEEGMESTVKVRLVATGLSIDVDMVGVLLDVCNCILAERLSFCMCRAIISKAGKASRLLQDTDVVFAMSVGKGSLRVVGMRWLSSELLKKSIDVAQKRVIKVDLTSCLE